MKDDFTPNLWADAMAMFKFDYDREYFTEAKNFILNATNMSSIANSAIKDQEQMPDYYSVSDEYGEVFSDRPHSDYTIVDFSSLDDAKEAFQKAYEATSNFNDRMYNMVGYISANIDPELSEIIKEVEKEVLHDYLKAGTKGGILEAVELYKLVERYGTDGLNLTDDQQTLLDYVEEQAEYAKLNGWEKFWQGAGTFLLSMTEGVVQVGEYVVDGAITVGGGLAGATCYIFDEETAQKVWDETAEVVDYKYAENLYDEAVDAFNIHDYIAYGEMHKLGYAAGTFTGEALLTMLPGGTAVKTAVQGLKTTGKSMNSTSTNDSLSSGERIVYAINNGAISATATSVIGANNSNIKDAIKDPIKKYSLTSSDLFKATGANMALRTTKSLATTTNDYLFSKADESYGEYMLNHANDIEAEVLGGAFGDIMGYRGAMKDAGYNITTFETVTDKLYKGNQKLEKVKSAFNTAEGLDSPEILDVDYDNVYEGEWK